MFTDSILSKFDVDNSVNSQILVNDPRSRNNDIWIRPLITPFQPFLAEICACL